MQMITKIQDLPLVLKVKDLAELLMISQSATYALIRSGQIRSIRLGKSYRIPRDAVEEFLRYGPKSCVNDAE